MKPCGEIKVMNKFQKLAAGKGDYFMYFDIGYDVQLGDFRKDIGEHSQYCCFLGTNPNEHCPIGGWLTFLLKNTFDYEWKDYGRAFPEWKSVGHKEYNLPQVRIWS